MEPSSLSPFSSLLGPNFRLRILFSDTLSLQSSLTVRDHVSQPYSITGNIIVLYILILKFLEINLERSPSSFARTIDQPFDREIADLIKKVDISLIDLNEHNANRIIPSYCHLLVCYRNLDRYDSLGNSKPQIFKQLENLTAEA